MPFKDDIVMVDNDVISERVEMVKRQTSYSDEEAKEALKKNNYDTMACIREYLEIPQSDVKSTKLSINQQIYKEIRTQLGTIKTPVYDPKSTTE